MPNRLERLDEELLPHHIYIYISIIQLYQKIPFFAATKWNFLVNIDTVIFPLKRPYRFSDNNKYRKKDINKILSEYAEMIRAVQLDIIRQQQKQKGNL